MTEDDPTFDLTKKKKKKKKTAFDPEADGEKQEVIVIYLQKILVYLLCIYQLWIQFCKESYAYSSLC